MAGDYYSLQRFTLLTSHPQSLTPQNTQKWAPETGLLSLQLTYPTWHL